MIYLQLFLSFLQIGLFSIGGGYAAMPLIQSQVVTEHGWLSMSEFVDLITIAEMTPGPIAVNAATFVGVRIAGGLGAVVSTLGCIFPSLVIVSILARIYARSKEGVALQTVLGCLRPTVVALIAAAGITIATAAFFSGNVLAIDHILWLQVALFGIAFFVLRRFKWNPILVMTCCGAVGLLVNTLTNGALN